jgi:lysine 2,3-aminomutase
MYYFKNQTSMIHTNNPRESIGMKAQRVLQRLLSEHPAIGAIFSQALSPDEAAQALRRHAYGFLSNRKIALAFFNREETSRQAYRKLTWRDFGAIRILDYIDNTGRRFDDLNLHGDAIVNRPFNPLWQAVKNGRGGGSEDYFRDMLQLFRQFNGTAQRQLPEKDTLEMWMERHPSGLDKEMTEMRRQNRERILRVIINRIEQGMVKSERYKFDEGMSADEKMERALQWWDTSHFHLKFAVRTPELLNEMLDDSLDAATMKTLRQAQQGGIPIFVNPYYLSLLNVDTSGFAAGTDQVIRDYVFVSRDLIDEFGHIVAWEKEDIVQPGEPNAAGWLLPSRHNIHRRYPEVAILIPDTVGRACGGLCVSCQRMYDFQSGHLNFDLDKLKPKEKWPEKLRGLLDYFENDSQLRDILITGGDALMSADKSIRLLLDSVYDMACRKIEANKNRPQGEKYAEMMRIRLGTRLPIYIPQRITPELTAILADFKAKASRIGFTQFVIQTHFVSAMEITPEVEQAIARLLSAGWIVTNQQVFTTAASVRGHTSKLRKTLNDIGVLTYYTFTVKGFQENKYNFATNARAVQEQIEEKSFGEIPFEYYDVIADFPLQAEQMVSKINELRRQEDLPFLGTDRNVLNMPGVGKSLRFRTIGITPDGRRILEFDHDKNRRHSPIIHQMGRVVIIESKSMWQYLQQLESLGEDLAEYENLWGYSIGITEQRIPVYEYPKYDFGITEKFTNFDISKGQ